ncbi:cell adhesion molecule CEACAM19-like [Dendrobates tinctorius]|uniref:cell adhesion molecule CEACAM19-like n=1 Tax=Dendrobates tinctorius TaxID=92724 RepID=UPI003CC96B4B
MRGFLILVLLVLTMDVTSGQISIELIPQYPVRSGSVTLSVTGITDKVEIFHWYKGPDIRNQYQILISVPGYNHTLVPRPLYNDRISVFNNGSLHIKDLRVTDGGNYIVVVRTLKSTKDAYVTLAIYENTEPINNSKGLIIGLTIGTILGGVLIITISVFLYRKILTKKRNESSENRQDHIAVYENVKAAQPREESSYMGLQFRTENTYAELKT